MEFIRLQATGDSYLYKEGGSIFVYIVAAFLKSDVGCYSSSFKKWALYDKGDVCGGNITRLEKDDEKVYLIEAYSEEKVPTRVEMTIHQFVKLLDEWQEKVCKKRPAEVIIIYQNGEFSIETNE